MIQVASGVTPAVVDVDDSLSVRAAKVGNVLVLNESVGSERSSGETEAAIFLNRSRRETETAWRPAC